MNLITLLIKKSYRKFLLFFQEQSVHNKEIRSIVGGIIQLLRFLKSEIRFKTTQQAILGMFADRHINL